MLSRVLVVAAIALGVAASPAQHGAGLARRHGAVARHRMTRVKRGDEFEAPAEPVVEQYRDPLDCGDEDAEEYYGNQAQPQSFVASESEGDFQPAGEAFEEEAPAEESAQRQGVSANVGASLGNGGGEFQCTDKGVATWYMQNGNAGHCGQHHSDEDFIVALPSFHYGNGEHCGKTVTITNKETGKTLDAKIADSCPTCAQSGSCDVDLSRGLWAALAEASYDKGIFDVTWSY